MRLQRGLLGGRGLGGSLLHELEMEGGRPCRVGGRQLGSVCVCVCVCGVHRSACVVCMCVRGEHLGQALVIYQRTANSFAPLLGVLP